MAAGDVHIIAKFIENMAIQSVQNKWASDTIKLGFITSSTTPSITDSNPCWGSGGSQNYSTNEVSAGGNYSAGGLTLSGCTVTISGAVTSLNATSPLTIAADASNPTNARWGIIYDNTTTNKEVIGYIDLGSSISFVSGWQFNINSASSGTQPLFQGTAT